MTMYYAEHTGPTGFWCLWSTNCCLQQLYISLCKRCRFHLPHSSGI